MKRAVLCVPNPEHYIDQLNDYSIMIVNPKNAPTRLDYLLNRADWSLLITAQGEQYRDGNNYENERVLWYTSGTTGDSKFYSFSQSQLDILANKICNAYDITANDRYTSIMNLSHAHGQGFYWATRLAGCETKFLSISELKTLPKTSPTFITAIPDILNPIAGMKFDNLRFIRSASSAMPDRLYQWLKEKHQVPVIEAFGMTEALSHCFTNPLRGEQRIGTVGLPDGIETDIVDNQLYIKGPTVFQPDWVNTGDIAEIDNHGYYRILGRSQDRINIRGIKIDPVSIETQIYNQFPGITECSVFGKTQLKCVYVGDVDPGLVFQYLVGLGFYCKPALLKSIVSIPKNNGGKVSRSLLDTIVF